MAAPPTVSLADVQAAATRIQGHAHHTPVMTCHTLDQLAGCKLHFKCENFQKVGAFKFRGAYNALSKLTPDQAKNGVVTHSSGNHAQAVALAAQMLKMRAHIVMPKNSSAAKLKAVQGYGADVVLCELEPGAREAAAEKLLKETGGVMIPPYDHVDVIAGQGTVALEFLQQVPHLDAIIVPIGGGGMISGISVAAKGINPNIRIFAAEPLDANDWALSFAAGKPVPLPAATNTIADGLRTNQPGKLTWPIASKLVEKVFTVTEEEIKQGMRLVWERMKLVIEPSAGVGVAVALKPEFKALGLKHVGVVLCGGNIDLDTWRW